MNADRRHLALEAAARALLVRVTRTVRANPAARAQILNLEVWESADAARWALAQAVDAVDTQTGGRRLARPSIELQAQADIDRQVRSFRAAGAELMEHAGRWYVRERAQESPSGLLRNSDWRLVRTPRERSQRRLYRAELQARRAAVEAAERRGIDLPDAREQNRRLRRRGDAIDWSLVPGDIAADYRTRVAINAGRIAQDAMIDTYRDGVFDRLHERQTDSGRRSAAQEFGWVRKTERNACGACLALADGAVHSPSDRTFWRHTRCRCIPWPITPVSTYRPPTGQEIWDSLSAAEQDELFANRGGTAKAEGVRDGRWTLADLVVLADDRDDRTDYVVGETPLAVLEAKFGAADTPQIDALTELDGIRTTRDYTPAELDAIRRWQSESRGDYGYQAIQAVLREDDGHLSDAQRERSEQTIDALSTAFAATRTKQQLTLYRTLRDPDAWLPENWRDSRGETWDPMGGLVGTSRGADETADFASRTKPSVILILTVPPGTPAIDIAAHGDPSLTDQREVLLGADVGSLVTGYSTAQELGLEAFDPATPVVYVDVVLAS